MTAIDEIEQYYPEVIDLMPKRFYSHEFIMKLAYHQGPLERALSVRH